MGMPRERWSAVCSGEVFGALPAWRPALLILRGCMQALWYAMRGTLRRAFGRSQAGGQSLSFSSRYEILEKVGQDTQAHPRSLLTR